ncbi:hypothetical protein K493DRAFT_384104 [Basidiobolus meristosporus CBS 931.73]|uniref:Galactose oxidase n=1 Tax=Basidiobolus meristosporus CBS 931.73 TaxID=1314790 RepID=A0A1Y1Z049_9FUNG|nr:hypothetical protein K493DRAFT_384104 [Basidiobolus meristosporus CBS 931.73]|eukprot:ORY03185.1 hypothetical protein K493DRAFT_384104 [Basidiobolus meristosporus CBS 931.73]
MSFLTKFTKPASNPTLWTQKRINKFSPFPRQDYSLCEILDDIYVFAGTIENIPQNDLHIIDSHDFSIEVAKTTGEIPCPRSGHTAVNIGRYLLGMLKDGDVTSNFAYSHHRCFRLQFLEEKLLTVGSKVWARLPMQSNSLMGRRDHSSVAIESTMYLFGGQVDGYYFNDLVAFDTKSLSTQTPRWEYIAPGYESPPERACHSAVVHKNQIYIFGGNDVEKLFDDLWCYDATSNIWSQIMTEGGPSKRTGHSACTHNDLMYIFGGKDDSGQLLHEVYVFHFIGIWKLRVPSENYPFTNFICLERIWSVLPGVHLGTTLPNRVRVCPVQDKVHILVGEYNSIASHSMVHVLDTAKVREYVNLHPNNIHPFSTVVNHSDSQDKQIFGNASPSSPTDYYRKLALSDNEDDTLTSSPISSEFSLNTSSPAQSLASISSNDPSHGSLQLSSVKTILDIEPMLGLDSTSPIPQARALDGSMKPAQVLNSPRQEGDYHLVHTPSHAQTEGTKSVESISKVGIEHPRDQIRQFATFIPLNIDKVSHPRTAELGGAKPQPTKQPNTNKGVHVNTSRKRTPGRQVAVNMQSVQPTYSNSTSPWKDMQVPEIPSQRVGLPGELSSIERIPEFSTLGSSGHNDITAGNVPVDANSVLEEKLPDSMRPEKVDPNSSVETKGPQIEANDEVIVETKASSLAADQGNTKTALWNSIQKMVSEKAGSSTKEAPACNNLEVFQKNQQDPEKIMLLQALLLLKDQLGKAQATVAQTCEYAAQKIADSERQRQVALQEAAYLKMKATAIKNSSIGELCRIEQERIAELEKRLVKSLSEKQALISKIDLQTLVSAKDHESRLLMEESCKIALNRALGAENNCRVIREKYAVLEESLKKAQEEVCEANTKASQAEAILYAKDAETTVMLERLASLEEASAQEREARELASNAVIAANERANEAERMWMDAQQEIQALEKESIELRKTVEQKSEELARAHFQAGEMETLWLTTKQQLDSIECMSRVFENTKAPSEGVDEKLTRANYRVAELEGELNLLNQMKEESGDLIERVERENQTLVQKMEELEKRHHVAQSELSEMRLRLVDSQDSIYEMKLQLMNSQDTLRAKSMELEGANFKVTALANMMQEMDCAGDLDLHRIVALASDKPKNASKPSQLTPQDHEKLRQQLESLQDHLDQTKSHNKELQEKYKNTLQELHSIVEKQQPLIISEKASKARAAADEHEIAKLKDQFLAMQVKANSLEELLRQSRPKPPALNNDSDTRLQSSLNKIQQLELRLQEAEKKSTRMEKDTQRAIKYVRDSESMLRKMKAELQRSQKQVFDLTKQLAIDAV